MKVVLFIDGACEPYNPGGNMGYGFLAKNRDTQQVIAQGSGYTPANSANSNNVAEYMALVEGLKNLHDIGLQAADILVKGDSRLVIEQMSGNWRAKGGLYFHKFLEAKNIASIFSNLKYEWIPRELNYEADALSKSHLQL